jgi:hypothetical protein
MFGKSYSDMVFTVNNQCKKIMRTWKVMDWCQQSTYGGFTVYSRVQYIYIINAEVPQITCPAQITIESSNCKNAVLNATPIVVSPGSCGGQPEVTNDSPYATSGGSNISGVYPIGTTKVTYRIKYGCGFYKFCSTNVVVTNASKPVPYCLGQLVTALMPLDTDHDGKVDNGMVEIWAKDLNKGSYTVCGNQPLIYSFSKNTNETSKTFTCDHIGSNMVEIWVTDSKGAQNYCITEVVVQNNGANIPNCKPKPVNPPTPKDTVYNVHGLVTTLTDTPLKNAEVTLEYKDPSVSYKITYDTSEVLTLDSFINLSGYKLYRYELTQKIIEKRDSTLAYLTFKSKTDSNGKYLFDSLNVKNKVISLKATYNDSTSLFIDHKDVELLTKYLLGEVKFTSYHQYLASDINEDGVIDITDQNILMSFVTGQIKVLPGVHQWYILDAKKSFAKPQDILTSPLPLAIVLDSITKNDVAHAFVAIKKGNISVDPGSATELYTENRVKPILPITINAYPNPFTDVVRFDLSNFESGPVTLVIYSISGQEVYKNVYQNSNNQHSIDVNLADVPEGMLVFRFNSEKMTAVGKLYHNK